MNPSDTDMPIASQQQKPARRIHTAITLTPEILVKVDAECDAERGGYEYNKSRSDVVESALRTRYGLPQVAMGRKKKRVAATIKEDVAAASVS